MERKEEEGDTGEGKERRKEERGSKHGREGGEKKGRKRRRGKFPPLLLRPVGHDYFINHHRR